MTEWKSDLGSSLSPLFAVMTSLFPTLYRAALAAVARRFGVQVAVIPEFQPYGFKDALAAYLGLVGSQPP
jgi:hypothetical protein